MGKGTRRYQAIEDEMGGSYPFIVIDDRGIPLSQRGRRVQVRRWKSHKAAQKVADELNAPIPQ